MVKPANGRYQHKRKTYVLKFEDYPGFEVTMKGLSTEGFMRLAKLAGTTTGKDLSQLSGDQLDEAIAAMDSLFARFAKSLVRWNLDDEDTGDPVPETEEGVRSQDFDFILEITLAWMDAIASVDPTSPPPASSPGISQESSLNLESLSSSLSS